MTPETKPGLNSAPRGERIHIAFFGLRNAGKSTLANDFTGQRLSIVSDVAGTTTDPVSKAMEILPLGPCVVTDTAGLDDTGELGAMRAAKSLDVLSTVDVAVWVSSGPEDEKSPWFAETAARCRANKAVFIVHRREDGAEKLKERIAALGAGEAQARLLEGLATPGTKAICVCPIDESAPKGRLILPQVQTIRECLDAGIVCTVCVPAALEAALRGTGEDGTLVITDSQAFREVRAVLAGKNVRLTSFSILFARRKGDFAAYLEGLAAIRRLKDGDTVLVAEGCTHKRQCNDIGTVKIPAALLKMSGRELQFRFASGGDFGLEGGGARPSLAVLCGGCMLTRREVLSRIEACRAAGVPVVNYGMLLAAASGADEIREDGTVST